VNEFGGWRPDLGSGVLLTDGSQQELVEVQNDAVSNSDPVLRLVSLGPTSQAAVRRLLTEFRSRRWIDNGAALSLVRALEKRDEMPVKALAKAAPPDFLTRNEITRRDLSKLLERLASEPAVR
jgi:hypothetical protein